MTAPRVQSVAALLMASILASTAHADCPHAASPGEAGSLTTPAITQAGGCRWMPLEKAWLAAPRIVVDARLRRHDVSPLPANAIERGAAIARIEADPDLPLTLIGSGLDRRSLDALCVELLDAGARDVVAVEGGIAGIAQQHAAAPMHAAVSAAEAHAAWLDGTAVIAVESESGFWTPSSAEGDGPQVTSPLELIEGRDRSRPLVIVAHLPGSGMPASAAPQSAARAVFVVNGGLAAWRLHLQRWQSVALAAESPLRTPCGMSGSDQ